MYSFFHNGKHYSSRDGFNFKESPSKKWPKNDVSCVELEMDRAQSWSSPDPMDSLPVAESRSSLNSHASQYTEIYKTDLSDPYTNISIAPSFTFQEVLGRGSYGQVYKVEYQGKLLALKHSQPSQADPDLTIAAHEANLLKSLDHKNIVKSYSAISDFEDPYGHTGFALTMDLATGGTVEDILLKKAPALSFPNLFNTALGVADAMTYLHKQEILHLDIKPANILFKQDFTPLVADFSLALPVSKIPEFRNPVCTPMYASPEVLIGVGENITTKGDIYSFGMLLYEMLLGKEFNYPDLQRNRQSSFVKIMLLVGSGMQPEKPKPPLSNDERTAECQEEMWNLAQDCLAQDFEERPDSPHVYERLTKIGYPLMGG